MWIYGLGYMTMGFPLKVTLHKMYADNDSIEKYAIKTIKCAADREDVRWIITLTVFGDWNTGAA